MKQHRQWWSIRISGYGSFAFFGTRTEADQTCAAKAEWEGGRGAVRSATPKEIDVEKDHLLWKLENGYPLTDNQLEALKS